MAKKTSKKQKEYGSLTLAVIVAVAIVIFFVILSFFWQNNSQSSASQAEATYTIMPANATFPVGQPVTVNVVVQPVSAGDRISALSLNFKTLSGIKVVNVGKPVIVPNTGVNPILVYSSAVQNVYTINAKDSQLPSLISVPVTFVATSPNASPNLIIGLVGPIPGYNYLVTRSPSTAYGIRNTQLYNNFAPVSK